MKKIFNTFILLIGFYSINPALSSDNIIMNDFVLKQADIEKEKQFLVSDFVDKYHLNLDKIRINIVYLKEGNNEIQWTSSSTIMDRNGGADILVALDKNGNLYNINRSFEGKKTLTEKEKKGLLEQTLLHEIVHAYTNTDKTLFNSSFLSKEDNEIFNRVVMSCSFPNIIKNIYSESRSEFMANQLYIKYNDDMETVNSVLSILQEVEKTNYEKLIFFQKIDRHMMFYEIDEDASRNSFKYKSEILSLTNDNILTFSKVYASDKTIRFMQLYGNRANLNNIFNNTDLLTLSVQKILVDMILNNGNQCFYNNESINNISFNILKDNPQITNKEELIIHTDTYTIPITKIQNKEFDGLNEYKIKIKKEHIQTKKLFENLTNSVIEVLLSKDFERTRSIIRKYTLLRRTEELSKYD